MSRQTKAGVGAAKKFSLQMRGTLRQLISGAACAALVLSSTPAPLWAQAPAPPASDAAAPQMLTAEQLDAMMAPIALYPDELLAQVMMASAFPLQVVAAARWAQDPANKALTGDALTAALAPLDWDPSVKSLVPFPQALAMMNEHLDWLQQLGFAVNAQQADVLASVQRLRKQAQIAGQLKSNAQQVVSTEGSTIVMAPAQPNVVYVPVYNPTVVYGAWPYPAYPPVYLPPPPGYVVGTALAAGIAFGVGVAVAGGLYGWARPGWNTGYVNVNVNRYNTINVNRPPINNPVWHGGRPAQLPAGYRPGAGYRPPAGGYRPPAGGYRPPAGGIRPPAGTPGRPTTPPGKPGTPPPRPGTPPGGKPGIPPGGKPGIPPGGKPGTLPSKPGTPSTGRPGGGTTPPGRPGGPPSNGGSRPSVPPSGGPARPPGGSGPGSRPPSAPGGIPRPGGGQTPPGAGTGTRPGGGPAAGSRPSAGQQPSGAGPNKPALAKKPGGLRGAGPGSRPAPARNRPGLGGGPGPNRG